MSDEEAERTVYNPGSLPPVQPSAQPAPAPQGASGVRIQPGDVLNHMYEVRRSIARGGMGEVFEGCNVNYAEERVAIKVILPHLAADPSVQSMFFKEARTLTRLNHPALVQYRTMAQEPQLGVFYIVTEFVDGPPLAERLRDLAPSVQELALLARRLAEGLAVAHAGGAIHRDISPDNILLEGGKVQGAKIIDFGIAKDLDPGSGTIVGDGFAGKLNYVAPEQLGEFGRDVGPWSDIYSLGLTLLAVARGRDVDMGGTIVDAVDKRRAGADLAPMPEPLRPLLQRMLASDPKQRMRSMEEVVRWLDDWAKGKIPAAAPAGKAPAGAGTGAKLAGLKIPPALKEPRGAMIAGGGALGLLALLAIGLSFTGGSVDENAAGDAPASRPAAARGAAAAPPADPVAAARTALSASAARLPCSWIEVAGVDGGQGARVSAAFRGVSGKSTQAMGQIDALLKQNGIQNASLNFSEVDTVPAEFCNVIDVFAPFRDPGGGHLSSPQTQFEVKPLGGEWGVRAGHIEAQVVVQVNTAGLSGEPRLIYVHESGAMQLFALSDFLQGYKEDLGGGKFRINLPVEELGWAGMILLSGKGPFDPKVFKHTEWGEAQSWKQRIPELARAQGWKSEMVWFKVVNEQPDAAH